MGELTRKHGQDTRKLQNQHLVGRSPECALRIAESYISGQHAVIRWSGSVWEAVDRGSRNGTRLDGDTLVPGRGYPMKLGATISFGHPDETWTLTDTSAPEMMLVDLDNGTSIVGSLGMVALPSAERPEVTLYRGLDGTWKIEDAEGAVRSLTDGEVLESAGKRYRLSLPSAADPTRGLEDATCAPSLHFAVSSDEDFVELALRYPNHRVDLGSRSHNYLLLTLARGYLEDIAAGSSEAASGWKEKDELARGLRMSPEQVDGEVHRVRRHFARHGLREAASIIERRPRTKQIRLGLRDVHIERR